MGLSVRPGLVLATLLALSTPVRAAPPRTPTAAVLSPDAALVAAQESGTIRIWERATGKLRASFKSEGMFRGALGVDSLAGIVADERVALWRAPSFAKALDLKHVPKVLSLGRVYLAANGRTFATVIAKDGGVGDPNTVQLFGERGKLLARVELERGRVQGVAFAADGQSVAIFGDEPGAREGALLEVHRLAPRGAKLRTLRLLSWRGPDRTTYSAAFAPDGKRLALGAGTRLLLFDVASVASARLLGASETDAVKALFPPPLQSPQVVLPGAHQLAFAPDGKRLCTLHALAVVGAAIWEVGSGPVSRARPLLKPVAWIKRPEQGTLRQLAFDGKSRLFLITASYGPEVWVFEARGDRFRLDRTLTP